MLQTEKPRDRIDQIGHQRRIARATGEASAKGKRDCLSNAEKSHMSVFLWQINRLTGVLVSEVWRRDTGIMNVARLREGRDVGYCP
jgi:hypothetical protein